MSAPELDLDLVLERDVLSALLHDPEQTEAVLSAAPLPTFRHPRHRAILAAIARLRTDGAAVDLVTLADALDRTGELAAAGSHVYLAELFDEVATAAHVEQHAHLLRRRSLERMKRELLRSAANGGGDEALVRLGEIEAELARAGGPVARLEDLGFTGERLARLRDRPEAVSPLPDLLDALPSLHVMCGKPKTGKTTFALSLGMPWCQGLPPWTGAGALPGSRVLMLSAEQSAVRIDSTLRRLDVFAEVGSRERWTERMVIVGRDAELPREARPLLTLDERGLALLRAGLVAAREDGDPFGLVILDSLSRLLPPELDENANGDMSRWLAELQELAEECGVWILLVHHRGHAERTGAVSAGRGASAIAAVAQVVLEIDRVPSDPLARVIRLEGNAVPAAEHVFAVARPDSPHGSVFYFRPASEVDRFPIDDLLEPGETISTSDLARRLAARAGREKVAGQDEATARRLRSAWERAGSIEIQDGPRNAKLLSRPLGGA